MTALIILGLFICIIIAVLAYQKYYPISVSEGFQTDSNTQLSFCPLNSTAYMGSNGDTQCCDGKVTDNECMRPLCSLAINSDLPSCTSVLDTYYKTQSASFCPSSMPQYYEDGKKTSGCSAGNLTADRTGILPTQLSLPKCNIYNSIRDYDDKDSCYNQRLLEDTKKIATSLFGNYKHSAFLTSFLVNSHYLGVVYAEIVKGGNYGPEPSPIFCLTKSSLLESMTSRLSMETDETTKKDIIRSIGVLKDGRHMEDCAAIKAAYIDKSIDPESLSR